MLWLALDFPHLPLAVYGGDSPALVVGADGAVLAAGPAARAAGVGPGTSWVSARRCLPGLVCRPRDEEAEAALLAELARWAGRFTSWVSLAPPRALLLEVGGSLSLFGGLARLERRLDRGLRALGHEAGLAVAPTPLGALWLARAGGGRIPDAARLTGTLAALPLAVLALPPRRHSALQGMGLATLGDLLRLPRDGLARRFGPGLLYELDRALGRRPDPRPRFVPPPCFRRCQPLPAPVSDRTALLFLLNRLLGEMAGMLRSRAAGVRELQVHLHHEPVRGGPGVTILRLAADRPSADPALWRLLARERLEHQVLAAPVERLGLSSGPLETLPDRGLGLFTRRAVAGAGQFIARLRARLGRRAVAGLELAADHRPERAWRRRPVSGDPEPATPPRAGGRPAPAPGTPSRRPLWLLPEPRLLAVRDGRPCWGGPLLLEPDGERVEGGWWDGADVRRDYFLARNPAGARLWVYRDLRAPDRWYLQGFFD